MEGGNRREGEKGDWEERKMYAQVPRLEDEWLKVQWAGAYRKPGYGKDRGEGIGQTVKCLICCVEKLGIFPQENGEMIYIMTTRS